MKKNLANIVSVADLGESYIELMKKSELAEHYNSVICKIPGTGMSFDKKITEKYIEYILKIEKLETKQCELNGEEGLFLDYNLAVLKMVEFEGGSSRVEIELFMDEAKVYTQEIASLTQGLEDFYSFVGRTPFDN